MLKRVDSWVEVPSNFKTYSEARTNKRLTLIIVLSVYELIPTSRHTASIRMSKMLETLIEMLHISLMT